MPKKPRIPGPEAIICGYIRKSQVKFPDDAISVEARAAHVEDLRRVRTLELIADAAADGLTIDAWYDDMGISGRGEFLEKREAFARLRSDAQAGQVRRIYARDLSRLFRDLTGQEVFFEEMRRCGVVVRAQDIPQGTGAPGILVRQVLGALNEYRAKNDGETIKRIQAQKIKDGHWTGRAHSMWGLTLNKATKGYDFEPEGAQRAIAFFERFIQRAGNARALAEQLNRQVIAGDPAGFRTRRDCYWTPQAVLRLINNSVWRRCATWGNLEVEVPGLIPEVVPLPLVLEAQALAAGRSVRALSGSRAGRSAYTYSGMTSCALCGAPARAWRRTVSDGRVTSSVYYLCSRLHRSRALCPGAYTVSGWRLDQCMKGALSLAADVILKEAIIAPDPGTRAAGASARLAKKRDGLTVKLARMEEEPKLLRDLYVTGETTKADYEGDIARWRQRRAALEGQIASLPAADFGVPLPEMLKIAAALKLAVDEIWHNSNAGEVLSEEKAAILLRLGARISLRILPHCPEPSRKKPIPVARPGRLLISLELEALGLTGERAVAMEESEEDFRASRRACWQWRMPKED